MFSYLGDAVSGMYPVSWPGYFGGGGGGKIMENLEWGVFKGFGTVLEFGFMPIGGAFWLWDLINHVVDGYFLGSGVCLDRFKPPWLVHLVHGCSLSIPSTELYHF